ncbi:MAG: hypothetical protein IJM14_02045 [Lachnospiraceae bacterium]|nr:hypothetical protein [Lachnospiraceae bacterium]
MPDTKKKVEKRSEQYFTIKGSDAASQLVAEIDRLNETKEKLTLTTVDKLLGLYEQLGVQLKGKYDTLNEDSNEAKMFKKMNKRFSKDYAALIRYKRKVEKAEKEKPANNAEKYMDDNTYTIEEFFENSRTRTINLSEDEMSKLSSVGASNSTRYKINFSLDDEPIEGKKKGDSCIGFFTPEKNAPITTNRNEYFKEKHEKNLEGICEKYPGAADLMKKIDHTVFLSLEKTSADYYLVVSPDRYGTDLDLDNSIDMIFNEISQKLMKNILQKHVKSVTKNGRNIKITAENFDDYFNKNNYAHFINSDKTFKAVYDKQFEKYLKIYDELDTAEKKYAFLETATSYMKELNAYTLRVDGAIDHYSDMSQRNALASAFADYFGCSDVIAYAEKMKIKTTKDGKNVTLKGTMMMPATGVDPSSPDLENPANKRNGFSYVDAKGLVKSVASLQFLDYLIGYTDRHSANFFLKFDENGKIIGVQGIDNDNSFGAKGNLNDTKQNFVALSDLRVIPKSMADAVKNANPEVLAVLMQGYGVNKYEIDKTVKRIKDVQEKLVKFEEIYKGTDPTYINPNVPRIVPDEDLDKLLVNEQLATNKSNNKANNIFGKMINESNKINGMLFTYDNASKEVRNNALDIVGSYYGMIGDVKQLKEMNDQIDAPESASLNEMKNALNNFTASCNAVPDMMLIKSYDSKLNKLNKNHDYHYYKTVDSFAKLKEDTRKALEATEKFIDEASNKSLASMFFSSKEKYQQYRKLNNDIKLYEDSIKKNNEELMELGKQWGNENAKSHPDAEAIKRYEDRMNEISQTLPELSSALNSYTKLRNEMEKESADLISSGKGKTETLSDKYEKYETAKAEVKFFEQENAKLKEQLSKYAKMLNETGENAPSPEETAQYQTKLTEIGLKLSDYKVMLSDSVAQKKALEQDSEIKTIIKAIKTRDNLMRFSDKLDKLENNAKGLEAYDMEAANIYKSTNLYTRDPYTSSQERKENVKKQQDLSKKNNSDKFDVTGIDTIGADVKPKQNEVLKNMKKKLKMIKK